MSEQNNWRNSSYWHVLRQIVTHREVQGCHDCPMLEVHAFCVVHCCYIPFPLELFIDPMDPQPPPPGCPLLRDGAIILTLEPPPEASRPTQEIGRPPSEAKDGDHEP